MAQNNLGGMYKMGLGVPQSYPEALHWYYKAAEQDYALTDYQLGKAYYSGENIVGRESNYVAAREYLEKYVAQFRQKNGRIVVEDADMKSVMSDALRMLQALYRFGRGTAVDVEKANRLLEEATQFGDPDAAAIARVLNGVNTLSR